MTIGGDDVQNVVREWNAPMDVTRCCKYSILSLAMRILLIEKMLLWRHVLLRLRGSMEDL